MTDELWACNLPTTTLLLTVQASVLYYTVHFFCCAVPCCAVFSCVSGLYGGLKNDPTSIEVGLSGMVWNIHAVGVEHQLVSMFCDYGTGQDAHRIKAGMVLPALPLPVQVVYSQAVPLDTDIHATCG